MNIKITQRLNLNSEKSTLNAADVVQKGGIIVYPTDTLYGFGVDARNSSAIKKLNKIKKRETPISVIAWSLDIVRSWSDIKYTDFESFLNSSPFLIDQILSLAYFEDFTKSTMGAMYSPFKLAE